MKVKEMNKQERPREKAINEGIASLSNRELIAVLLRSGTKDKSVLELADELLQLKPNLLSLMDLQPDEIMRLKGIKAAKATQILACFELIKRISQERMKQDFSENGEIAVVTDWLMNHIGHKEQEYFVVLFLNRRGKMIAYRDMFIGTGTKSFANPREVFREALHHGSSKIICAHNHPSGNIHPSIADYNSADALEQSGELLGIKVVDHIIVSRRAYYSFREHLEMREQRLYQQQAMLAALKKQEEKPPASAHHNPDPLLSTLPDRCESTE